VRSLTRLGLQICGHSLMPCPPPGLPHHSLLHGLSRSDVSSQCRPQGARELCKSYKRPRSRRLRICLCCAPRKTPCIPRLLPDCAVTSAPAACSHSRSRAAQTKEVPEGSAQSAPAPQTGKRAALLRKVKTFGGSAKQNVYDLTGALLLCLAADHRLHA
jgi:hypothetical protein